MYVLKLKLKLVYQSTLVKQIVQLVLLICFIKASPKTQHLRAGFGGHNIRSITGVVAKDKCAE
jgi:hypothetical protein